MSSELRIPDRVCYDLDELEQGIVSLSVPLIGDAIQIGLGGAEYRVASRGSLAIAIDERRSVTIARQDKPGTRIDIEAVGYSVAERKKILAAPLGRISFERSADTGIWYAAAPDEGEALTIIPNDPALPTFDDFCSLIADKSLIKQEQARQAGQ